eukprot:COSAG06_NODE_1793_length_8391_cov_49.730134_6_plen_60_part_00
MMMMYVCLQCTSDHRVGYLGEEFHLCGKHHSANSHPDHRHDNPPAHPSIEHKKSCSLVS